MIIGKISKWKKIKLDAHLTPNTQINFILLQVLNVKKNTEITLEKNMEKITTRGLSK